MNYKYTLDKSSRKFICPVCQKRRFVRYLSTDINEYLAPTFGRCDRESKCGYHFSPKRNTCTTQINRNMKIHVSESPSCHNDDVIGYFGRNYSNNNLIYYLLQFFSSKKVAGAIKKYFIGTSSHWNGATIFWQVDEHMNVCAGKVMLYDKTTGNRVKKPYPYINWMHKVLHLKKFVLQQCLFGIHNLCDYNEGSTICIVESEKTAIIMSMLLPDYLWLATGSKSNLKDSLLKPLRDYKVIVFPDKTEFDDWNEIIIRLRKESFNVSCSSLLENKNLEEGVDLVDFLLKN